MRFASFTKCFKKRFVVPCCLDGPGPVDLFGWWAATVGFAEKRATGRDPRVDFQEGGERWGNDQTKGGGKRCCPVPPAAAGKENGSKR